MCAPRHHHHRPPPKTAAATVILLLLLLHSAAPAASLTRFSGAVSAAGVEGGRRRLRQGPGSWPPSCRSKCGRCAPCKAVHVPIKPGMSMPLEYYPEAWRCKCGNKLYMP